jgi:hypothetical protein
MSPPQIGGIAMRVAVGRTATFRDPLEELPSKGRTLCQIAMG